MTKPKHKRAGQAPAQEAPACEQPQDVQEEAAAQAEGCQPEAQGDALAQAERQRDEYLNLAQRAQADFDNFRRRNQAVRAEAVEDGAREVLTQLLPVLDNLERAADAAQGDASPLREGIDMVLRQMRDTLGKFGVTEIHRLGEPFDPELEHAVMQGGAEEGEPGTVCAVLQKGYKTEKRVLRFAMVKVVAG